MKFNLAARLFTGAALMSALAACGGGDKSAQQPSETASVETAPAAEPAAVPEVTAVPEVAAVPGAAAVSYASLIGDAAHGEKVFTQCKACHVAEPGVNRIGPSLWGVVGRRAGSIEGYNYSAANKNSGLMWSDNQLYSYLEAPRKVVPGTKMSFAGLKNPQDRADLIAYLKTKA